MGIISLCGDWAGFWDVFLKMDHFSKNGCYHTSRTVSRMNFLDPSLEPASMFGCSVWDQIYLSDHWKCLKISFFRILDTKN